MILSLTAHFIKNKSKRKVQDVIFANFSGYENILEVFHVGKNPLHIFIGSLRSNKVEIQILIAKCKQKDNKKFNFDYKS